MKYVDEYRDIKKCARLASLINKQARSRSYKIMEVCGTHTAAIRKFGLKSMLLETIELISGPGCPVCVTSDGYLKNAISLCKNKKIIIATYPDMLGVPVGGKSLEQERSQGCDIRAVNSALEALDLARRSREKEVVFLAVGFETTAPGTAIAVKIAKSENIHNFNIYSAHKTIPEALLALGKAKDLAVDGFLLPGHVSAIIGLYSYKPVVKNTKIPSVISGFEALDILLSIYKIVSAANEKKAILENEYTRIVADRGNLRAKALLDEVFEKKDGFWRGLGVIKDSALSLRSVYRNFDAAKKFFLKEAQNKEAKNGCLCGDVLKGKIAPLSCPYFSKGCTPQTPFGPCMVSREGTCRSFFEYR